MRNPETGERAFKVNPALLKQDGGGNAPPRVPPDWPPRRDDPPFDGARRWSGFSPTQKLALSLYGFAVSTSLISVENGVSQSLGNDMTSAIGIFGMAATGLLAAVSSAECAADIVANRKWTSIGKNGKAPNQER
ncbi:MAG: hypothetical protein H6922_03625 [Pseudomonadaceae bacterium]|nr:hypothetical protein [Pseudomonadaceae bacterium]